MHLTAESRIHVDDIKLSDLMHNVATGVYRIPRFQRDYVWGRSKVVELFDSIYQEFPIGSFFIWKAHKQYRELFREVPDLDLPSVEIGDTLYFIIDGQQRIASIYVTLHGMIFDGTDYGRIVFDLQEEVFRHRTPDGRRYVAVCDIWGPNSMGILRSLPAEYSGPYERCWQALQTYPIPVVEVREQELDAVCRIFQRINQGGQRLDRFDLVAAMTFTPDFDLRDRFKQDVLGPLERSAFGAIDPSIVTQLLALLVSGQCTQRYEYSLKSDHIKGHWEAVVDAVLLTADTLRKDMGVMNAEYLPYNALFTLLAYYYAKSGSRALAQAHLEWVRRWFWRSSFGQHYGAAAPTQMGRDKPMFDSLIEGEPVSFDTPLTLTAAALVKTRMTWRASAIRNAYLCLLGTRNPLHLVNNTSLDLVHGTISEFTKSEKHHIFPVAFLRGDGPSDADIHALPNFCFLPSELNKRIRDSSPAEYFPMLVEENPEFDAAARSHLIPLGPDSGVADNDYVKFLKGRAELILEEIGRLCGGITAPRQEERQAAIERLEHRWRDLIHDVLTEGVGDGYWKANVPQAVRDEAERRIKEDIRKHPELAGRLQSPRAKIDYLNVMDYATIAENGANWSYFQLVLRSKADLQNYMRAFNEYRNCVMHSRGMTELIRMAGETAMVWFESVLPEERDGEEMETLDYAEVADDE